MSQLSIGQNAPLFRATALDGRVVDLASYRGKKVWISFYRYAGCPLCNLHLFQVLGAFPRLQNQGLEFVAIFESKAKKFPQQIGGCSTTDFPFPLVSDPGKDLYRLYSTEQRLSAVTQPEVAKQFVAALRAGFQQKIPDGSFLQVPAHFLVGTSGELLHAHYGKNIADQLSVAEVESLLK